jgi:hypothetical protein
MITKQGMALWSTRPPDDGFRFADVSDETPYCRARASHPTTARIDDGYTVMHSRWRARAPSSWPPRHGRRCVASGTDTDLAAAMVHEEAA